MPEQVTPQQLLHSKVTSSRRAGTPQLTGDGPRLLAALPKRAEPPAPRTGLAKSHAQLACGQRASGEGSTGLLQAQGPSQLLGLPVPKAGSAGLLY